MMGLRRSNKSLEIDRRRFTHLEDSLSGTEVHGWQNKSVQTDPPQVDYEDVMTSEKGVGQMMQNIKAMGFCFVNKCPLEPHSSEALLEKVGPIRHTHYGAFYDFTSDLALKDTAYTSEALDLHTDTTYFNDPAGLQMFHLLSHTEGAGGGSQLVDGYAAAHELKCRYKHAYASLSDMKVIHHASGNEGIRIQSHPHPILQRAEDSDSVQLVRWNNADRGDCHMTPSPKTSSVGQLHAWYDAAR
ncbi:MAG: hypothetical protein M1831_002624 [Alyxoria varia]|nr:MAG: hypothetical protein M1831_002624 [Alyxoria varia]